VAGLVHLEVEDGVAVLTLHDPPRRNAISAAMNAELVELVGELEADAGVGAIVLSGSGPTFCAGADLEQLRVAQSAADFRDIYGGFLRVAGTSLPTIAAVNGAAVGAGMNVALACDLVLAGEAATFDSRFLQIGIHPGGGHMWRLGRVADLRTVRAMVLFGETLDAAQAVDVGVAWRRIADADLLDEAKRLARAASRVPRELMARTKATIASLGSVATGDEAVELELAPQTWSARQPTFEAMLGTLRERIGGRPAE
jgi:enoyl-CoA hydratase